MEEAEKLAGTTDACEVQPLQRGDSNIVSNEGAIPREEEVVTEEVNTTPDASTEKAVPGAGSGLEGKGRRGKLYNPEGPDDNKKVISYGLYGIRLLWISWVYCHFWKGGSNPRYINGALRNVENAKKWFPGWVVRFYVVACLRDFVQQLCSS